MPRRPMTLRVRCCDPPPPRSERLLRIDRRAKRKSELRFRRQKSDVAFCPVVATRAAPPAARRADGSLTGRTHTDARQAAAAAIGDYQRRNAATLQGEQKVILVDKDSDVVACAGAGPQPAIRHSLRK